MDDIKIYNSVSPGAYKFYNLEYKSLIIQFGLYKDHIKAYSNDQKFIDTLALYKDLYNLNITRDGSQLIIDYKPNKKKAIHLVDSLAYNYIHDYKDGKI